MVPEGVRWLRQALVLLIVDEQRRLRLHSLRFWLLCEVPRVHEVTVGSDGRCWGLPAQSCPTEYVEVALLHQSCTESRC